MKRNAFLTIPNLITLLGFIFIVLYVDSFLDGQQITAFLFLFLAGCSDALDGFLARRLKQESIAGAILDPVRDRTIMLALLFVFWCMQGNVSLILTLILLEAAIFILWLYHISKEDYSRVRHIFGKGRQAGHLIFGGLGVFGLMTANQALAGMVVFSALLLKLMIGKLLLKKFLDFPNTSTILTKGGFYGL